NSGHYCNDQPQQADQRDIKIEVLCEAGAHPGNFSVGPWPYQLFAREHGADSLSAVGTHIGIILDHFAAVVAVHNFASTYDDTANRPKSSLPSACLFGGGVPARPTCADISYSSRYASFMCFRAVSAGGVWVLVASTA